MKKIALVSILLIAIGIAFHFAAANYPYNILLISIDTLRADFLSCYNPKASPTPNIDRIANEGVLFERAYSLIPITLPSHTVMFTSRYPHEMRVFNNGELFAYNFPVLTDFFRQKKYRTAAFISLGVLGADFGLGRAFEVYEDHFDPIRGRYYKTADEVNELALPWIEENKSKRFFSWIHYSDPHDPYVTADAPPDTRIMINGRQYGEYCLAKREYVALNLQAEPGENQIQFEAIVGKPQPGITRHAKRFIDSEIFVAPKDQIELQFGSEWEDAQSLVYGKVRAFDTKAELSVINRGSQPVPIQIRFLGGIFKEDLETIRKNYEAEVKYVDDHIGLLLEMLDRNDLLKKTIIVLTADHGEGLRDHRILGHVNVLYEEVTHVPLIVRYPMLGRRGARSKELVNHLDIMPTLLDLIRLKNEKPMQGFSLKRHLSRSPIDWVFSISIPRTRTFSSTFKPEARFNAFSVIDGQHKLIYTPARPRRTWEYFDLMQDRAEKKNLTAAGKNPAQLKSILDEFRKDAEASHSNRTAPVLDESQQQMLKALGYVAGEEE